MKKSKPSRAVSVYQRAKKSTEKLYSLIVSIFVEEGLSQRAIANRLRVSKGTVYRHLCAWKQRLPVEDMKPAGRPPKITPPIRSTLGQLVASQTVPTSKSLATALSKTNSALNVTPRTVRNHLKFMNYQSSIPRTIPLLTDLQQQKRVEWCLNHLDFVWDNVWFSDETYIEVNQISTRVWHARGKRPCIQKPKFRLKIMCWGAVSTRFKSKLAIVEGTMTSDRYIETLQGYLFNEKSKKSLKKMVFQQDGATCHTAKKSKTFLSASGVTVLTWPANSPDLNPIENIWSILKHEVEIRGVKTKEELINAVEEEWKRLDQEIIKKTIETMRKRIEQVVERGGKKCDY